MTKFGNVTLQEKHLALHRTMVNSAFPVILRVCEIVESHENISNGII